MSLVEAEARFCPDCGSPSVDYSVLESGTASCRPCGWVGRRQELLVAPYQHDFGSDDGVVQAFLLEFRNTLARTAAVDLARMFLKWGLLPQGDAEKQKKGLSRLLAAMARGAVQELLRERAALEASHD